MKMDFAKDGYIITKWIDHHNHQFIDVDKRHFLPYNSHIQQSQKYVIDNHMLSGISQRATFDSIYRSIGGPGNLDFVRKDLKNDISIVRQKAMAPGEATVFLNWFREETFLRSGSIMM
ncbi:hypothetical protein LIER_16486 [Lithospermum erythrorhizon]|uniref:Protein FAR1-RELATED SEQUENCE n=1 Tax=Lithospermum erythrorhizon TaxID=34254 RepID=A0AAV3Q9E2_LITER